MANPNDELEALRSQVATLTARVYRLEMQSGVAPAVEKPSAPPPAAAPPQVAGRPGATPPASSPPPAMPRTPAAATVTTSAAGKEDIESKIGRVWMNRIGILAILTGVVFFIKYAFDSGWIGKEGRIALGLLGGIGVVIWSENFRRKGYAAFSYSLKAVGIGTMYISLWGAFQVYHLINADVAFVAMIVVTASTVALALSQDAQILAAYSLVGGFMTPLLLSTGENHEVVLFSYVAVLDLGMLVLCVMKPWRRLLWGSFVGTLLLYYGWYSTFYTWYPTAYAETQRPVTVFFAALFAAIFAAVPLLSRYSKSVFHSGPSLTLTALPLLNAGNLFLALYAMYQRDLGTLTWYALALAAIYLALANLYQRREAARTGEGKAIALLHVAIAIAFITIAIPLKLDGHWITIGWLVESAALLVVAVRTETNFIRHMAVAALLLGLFRMLFLDNFHVDTLVFNARFATYLVAVAILGGIVAAGRRIASEAEQPWISAAGVGLNLLALLALTMEANDYFSRARIAVYGNPKLYRDAVLAGDFSLSVIWLLYGVGLIVFGFWKQSAFVRWQALVLLAFTIGKVFLYDTSNLEQGYRVLSFFGLGAALMGMSYFVYHRDWLNLSNKNKKAAGGSKA